MEANKRLKRGDIRADGMIFWRYRHGKECWITYEKLLAERAKDARAQRTLREDPVTRERHNARQRKRHGSPEFLNRARVRYQTDPLFATTVRLRNRTRHAFRRIRAAKPTNTETLLGSDWETVKAHIESQFIDGMNWDNMSEWHIDHIVPLASAKTEEELCALCHYTNLQPLFAFDNLSKGARITESATSEPLSQPASA